MQYDSKRRSVIKTISWRFLATLTTAIIVWLFTGELVLAVSIGSVEVVAKIILYFFHERAWNKIRFGRRTIQPFVIWFTGLSGAGKSTLAAETVRYLQKRGLQCQQLDGDKIREIFPNTGFTKKDRDMHVRRVGYLAAMLEQNNVIVVAALISPYRNSRAEVRKLCRNFVEVHVSTPLEECVRRDPKGLYRDAQEGKIEHFTGINAPYETPQNPEVEINTEGLNFEESFDTIRPAIDRQLAQCTS